MILTGWHFYSKTTGIFSGEILRCSAALLAAELARRDSDVGALHGAYDYLSQRVDVPSEDVIDWVPEAPEDTADLAYAWDSATKRWRESLTVAGRQAVLRARVERLMLTREIGSLGQARATREVLLALISSTTPPAAAVTRLNDVDAAIVAWRATIASIDAAATQAELDTIEATL